VKTKYELGRCVNIYGVVPLRKYSFNLRVFKVLHSDEFTLDSDFFPVGYSANIQALEEGSGFVESKPESSVIVVIEKLFVVVSPLGAGGRPLALPLDLAEGISAVDELGAVLELPDDDNGESVPVGDSALEVRRMQRRIFVVLPSLFAVRTQTQQVAFGSEVEHHLPEGFLSDLLQDVRIFEVVALSWTPSQVHQSFRAASSSQQVVASVKFCVSFFYKRHP